MYLLHCLVVDIRGEGRAVALAEAQRLVAADVGRPSARRQRERPPLATPALAALHLVDPPQRQQALHHPRPACGRCLSTA